MMKDDVLEESHSAYLNPLTVVQREGKNPRICVDARKINQLTLPDRTKVTPVQEILQRFHGTRFITTLDLSSAFLQVPLDKASRKYTAFEFQSKVFDSGVCFEKLLRKFQFHYNWKRLTLGYFT
jgi:hypothetical protein